MARYSRVPNEDPEIDSGVDADSVALMQSEAPRKHGHGASEYVQLQDLDEAGRPRDPRQRGPIALEMKNSSRTLLMVVVGVALVLLAGGAIGSAYQRTHHKVEPPEHYLVKPVPREPLSNGTHSFNRTTLVLSLDGMNPHYVSLMRTPNLHNLVLGACAVPYMEPSFPTQTFPNHWTMVTGRYPINHGIVGNTFLDPELELEFVNTDPEKSLNPLFWGGEPLWATAKKHGLRSAVHMWPGSEVKREDGTPDYVSKFDPDEPLSAKLAKITEWLDMAQPPELMLTYVPNVDAQGHKYGISGVNMVEVCMQVDRFVGDVVAALDQRNLTDVVNLVVVSDHGMAPTDDGRLVFLDDVVSNWDNVTSNQGWPLAGLRFSNKDDLEDAYTSAKSVSLVKHSFRVFKSEETPRRWRFTTAALNSPDAPRPHGPGNDYDKRSADGVEKEQPVYGTYKHRLAPLYIVPEVGYSLLTHEEWDKMGRHYDLAGVHGYDNQSPLMRALFVARGPAFPKGKYKPFPNVDLYSAICRSVGIPEAEDSDGNFSLWPLRETIKEQYPGVDFAVPMIGSTFENF